MKRARQVGKTTISKQLLEKHNGIYFNADKLQIRDLFESKNVSKIISNLDGKTFAIIDEAQKIPGIGEVLKILIDEHPEIQWLATGSSSFDLANETAEPLTGRKKTFTLFPLSISEMKIPTLDFSETLESLLIYGSYPDIFLEKNESKKRLLLNELSNDYLYKDVLEFELLKKSDLLHKLLQAIALQLGSEVSHHELAVMLQTSPETIQRYLSLLEKSFVIFPLSSFSRNLQKELGKKKKYYFYDLGIRNSLIQNMAQITLRNDIGALWENFCIVERMKYIQKQERIVNNYFWRTYDQKEINFIEEDGILRAFEMKWNTKKIKKAPKDFLEAYNNVIFSNITPDNFLEEFIQYQTHLTL